MEAAKGTRLRLNVSTTSKGWYSWDHTVEIAWDVNDIPQDLRPVIAGWVVELSDMLEAECWKRYGHLQDKPKEA